METKEPSYFVTEENQERLAKAQEKNRVQVFNLLKLFQNICELRKSFMHEQFMLSDQFFQLRGEDSSIGFWMILFAVGRSSQ